MQFRKTLSVLFIISLGFAFSGCSTNKEENNTDSKTTEIQSQEETKKSGELVNMSPEEFQTLVSSQPFVVVDFYAVWCRPCIEMAPHLAKIAGEYQENQFKLVKIDAEKNTVLADQQAINSYPTIKIYKDGKEVATKIGSLNEEKLRELFAQWM